MSSIHETDLPGVGTRFTMETHDRRAIGVIHHHDGRREIFLTDAGDPDCVAAAVSLDEGEAHQLADLLGGTELAREADHLAQGVAGLTVDWIEMGDRPSAAESLGDIAVEARTGASVLAVLRGEEPHPSPGPGFSLAAGDIVLVVGTSRAVQMAGRLLRGEEASP
jgi:TrkA domain protein